MSQPLRHHAPQIAIAPLPQQGTTERATSLDRMRDAVGAYPAHAVLEHTEMGREILDAAAQLQLAYADAARGHSAILAEAGHRSAGDLRKYLTGEKASITLADLSALLVVTPERYRQFVTVAARLGGLTVDRTSRPGRTMASSIADLQRLVSELTASYVEALEDDGVVSASERQSLADQLSRIRVIETGLQHLLDLQK